jgi:hypothetical protein
VGNSNEKFSAINVKMRRQKMKLIINQQKKGLQAFFAGFSFGKSQLIDDVTVRR